jgi:hypothetical protein
MIPNGQVVKLSGESPKNLAIHVVPIATAISDMKYMMQNKHVTNNMMNLSRKHRGVPFRGPIKKEIWDMLKTLVASDESEEEEEGQVAVGTTGGTKIGDDLWD